MNITEALKNSFTNKWTIRHADDSRVNELKDILKIPKVLAKLLVLRNIIHPKEAEKFLYTTIENMHDPFLMKGMEKLIE